MNNIVYAAFHEATVGPQGEIMVPACVMTITEEGGIDGLGEAYMAKLQQTYARPNRKIIGVISPQMFCGKKGIEEFFYCDKEVDEYVQMLTKEGYSIIEDNRISRKD